MAYIGSTPPSRFVSNRAVTQFSGNGSNKVFTLEQVVTQDEDILVSVDGVIQEPSVSYVVSSGTTLTFQGTAAPSANSGNNIFVYYLASQVGTVGHPSTQGLAATSGTFSTTLSSTGNATVGGTLGVTGTSTLTGVTALGNTGSTVKSEGGAVTTNIAQGLAKCWVGTAKDGAADDDFNIDGFTDLGSGTDNSCAYTSAMANDDYSVPTSSYNASVGNRTVTTYGKTTLLFKMRTFNPADASTSANEQDAVVFGDLA